MAKSNRAVIAEMLTLLSDHAVSLAGDFGPDEQEPNATYVRRRVANMRAIIQAVDEMFALVYDRWEQQH